ncbi:MAG: class I SAM-dependent methyltransferase [Candidatus Heimdallarchaeota archaeon]|nr:MAG: class I SAM-dependent methyltransferase [Candidatus Heimdallarchaeota archaeon]
MSISCSQNRDKKILSELESVINDLGVDHLPTFGGKYEGGIHLQQIADEIAPCIYDLMKVNSKFKNFLEIGSAAGGNTYLFNHFFNFENITIIDDNRHKKHGLRKEILKDIKYREFIGDSHSQQAVRFLENLELNYDIIFIDGDHSYEGVGQDFQTYRKFLNYKGFIILHDTYFCKGIKCFANELEELSFLSFTLNPKYNDRQPIEFFGKYISKEKRKLGIMVFRIHSIPIWREKK